MSNPIDYDYSEDVDYSAWSANTQIDFLNVTWDAEYRDVVRFPDRAALDAFCERGRGAHTFMNFMQYVKPNAPIMVDLPFNVASLYNYVRVNNPKVTESDIQKNYYYFITGVEYVSTEVTAIYVQLDVWQTYIYDVTFGNAYIERGHIGVANSKNFDSFGRKYLTVPEGLDAGSEMRYVAKRHRKIMGLNNNGQTVDWNCSILVIATQDLESDPGTKNNANMTTARGTLFESVVTGAGVYGFATPSDFILWMDEMKDKSWRTQSLLAIYIVPKLTRYSLNDPFDGKPSGKPVLLDGYASVPLKPVMFPNWRNSSEILNKIPERYRHLKKFLTFPYMAIEMTTWTGTPVLLKPESWADADALMLERASLLPPNQRIEFIPRRYNGNQGDNIDNWDHLPDNAPILNDIPRYVDIGDDGADYLDVAVRIQNFISVPTVSSGSVAYLAANQASISQAYNQADWSQQRALYSNSVSYDQATKQINTNEFAMLQQRSLLGATTDLTNRSIANSQNISTGVSVGQGIAGLNPLAMVGRGIDLIGQNMQAANQIGHNTDQATLQSLQMTHANQLQRGNAEYMRDTNKEMADWAAKGDYAQTIAALNAKVRDAQMIQPTMSGQFGGENINLTNNTVELSVRWKMIDEAAITSIGEIWLQFGYQVQRQVTKLPDNLMVMSNFTYWKCSKAYLRAANMPETHRQSLRGIIEKGVTVWSDPDKIGFTDFADNEPLEGITL